MLVPSLGACGIQIVEAANIGGTSVVSAATHGILCTADDLTLALTVRAAAQNCECDAPIFVLADDSAALATPACGPIVQIEPRWPVEHRSR